MEKNQQVKIKQKAFGPKEDEIELMDLLKVLWKWKYLILAGTFVFALVAAIVSFNMTKIYGVKTVLAPGVSKIDSSGEIISIVTLQEMKTIIESGALEKAVLEGLKASVGRDFPKPLSFSVSIPKRSNALEVEYETPQVDLGLRIMALLNQALLRKFDAVVDYAREEFAIRVEAKASESSNILEKIQKAKSEIGTYQAKTASDIKEKHNQILTKKAQIVSEKAQIGNMKKRISEIEVEIGRISKNTDLLLEERNRFLGRETTNDNVLSAVVYSNTIQQNISYLNELRGQNNRIQDAIYKSEADIEAMENTIKNIEEQIITIKALLKYGVENVEAEISALESKKTFIVEEIKNLTFKKDYVQNIQILQPPKSSPFPVRPRTKLNILLAGVVGFFLTVFAAFLIQYIANHKSKDCS